MASKTKKSRANEALWRLKNVDAVAFKLPKGKPPEKYSVMSNSVQYAASKIRILEPGQMDDVGMHIEIVDFPGFGATLSSASAQEGDLAERLLGYVEQVDPLDIAQLCKTYGLKRDELGRLTGFSLRALADWSAGKLPGEPAKRRLQEIRRLLDSLAKFVPAAEIALWLKSSNPAFGTMTPLQVIEIGQMDRLWQLVHAFTANVPD